MGGWEGAVKSFWHDMRYAPRAAVGLGSWWGGEPQHPHSQTSSGLIYNRVKGPVRAASLGEDICGDVWQAAGSALLTHAHTNPITHTQAKYQRMLPPTHPKGAKHMELTLVIQLVYSCRSESYLTNMFSPFFTCGSPTSVM